MSLQKRQSLAVFKNNIFYISVKSAEPHPRSSKTTTASPTLTTTTASRQNDRPITPASGPKSAESHAESSETTTASPTPTTTAFRQNERPITPAPKPKGICTLKNLAKSD